MKKTGIWPVFSLSRFVLRTARMSSMLAPVVPMKLAISAPTARNAALVAGRAWRSPVRAIPPLMT